MTEQELKFLTFLENDLEGQCAFICDKPLFYTTKSAKLGPVKTECLEQVVSPIGESTPTATICIISAAILFLSANVAFPLCYRFKLDNIDEDD